MKPIRPPFSRNGGRFRCLRAALKCYPRQVFSDNRQWTPSHQAHPLCQTDLSGVLAGKNRSLYATFKLTVDFPKQPVLDSTFPSPSKAKLQPFRDQNSSSRDRFPPARLHSRPIDENLLTKPPFEPLLPRRLVFQRRIEIGHDEFHHHAEGIGVRQLTIGHQNDGISHRL